MREKLVQNVTRDTELRSDESRLYTKVGTEHAAHRTVNHSAGEYVSKDGITTNTVESVFSVFKRGRKGVYQHCKEKHLHRYLAEYDFRYNHRKIDDFARAEKALKCAEGKRLTYQQPHHA